MPTKSKSTKKVITEKPKVKVKTAVGKTEKKEAAAKASRLSGFADKVYEFASEAGQSIEDAVKSALQARQNVIMARVREEHKKKMDRLVEAGMFKSRSESAAFLISEGIRARHDLFNLIEEKTEAIEELREDLRQMVAGKIKSRR